MAGNTLRSDQTVHIVDLVSEGPIEGLVDGLSSVYLNNIPVRNAKTGGLNHKKVTLNYRKGYNNQTYIEGLPGTESERGVNAVLQKNLPVEQAISSSEVDSCRVTMQISQLVGTGKRGPIDNAVEFRIEVSPGDGTWKTAGINDGLSYQGISIANQSTNQVTVTTGPGINGIDMVIGWYNPSSTSTRTITYDEYDYTTRITRRVSTTKTILDGTPPNYVLEYRKQGGVYVTYASGTFLEPTGSEYSQSIRLIERNLEVDTYEFRSTFTGGSGVCYMSGAAQLKSLDPKPLNITGSSTLYSSTYNIDTVDITGGDSINTLGTGYAWWL